MTRKEFELFRLSLEKEKLSKAVSDPIDYGIQRTLFKKEKLKRLIGVGKNVSSRTVQAKVQRWQRQLNRLDESQAHLVALKKDIDAGRLTVSRPGIPLAAHALQRARVTPRVET
jgi:ribosome maturation factor RimP